MKTILFVFMFCLYTLTIFSQTPQSFKYQAAVRDNTGNVLANKAVTFRISILQGQVAGTPVYSELHAKTTNILGLIELEIGNGTSPSGSFTSINWGVSSYFLKVEMDPAGGIAFQTLGTSQLLSVPYALMAKDVESVSTDATLTGNGNDTSPLKIAPQAAASGQVLKWNGTTWKPGSDLTGSTAPGGTSGQIQFNNTGIFGGDPSFSWNNTSKRLGIGTTVPKATLDVEGSMVVGTNGKIFSEIIEITGTTPNSSGTLALLDYPNGYNMDNTRVLSCEIKYNNTHWTSLGMSNSTLIDNIACYLSATYIAVTFPLTSSFYNKPVRILLMKVQ